MDRYSPEKSALDNYVASFWADKHSFSKGIIANEGDLRNISHIISRDYVATMVSSNYQVLQFPSRQFPRWSRINAIGQKLAHGPKRRMN